MRKTDLMIVLCSMLLLSSSIQAVTVTPQSLISGGGGIQGMGSAAVGAINPASFNRENSDTSFCYAMAPEDVNFLSMASPFLIKEKKSVGISLSYADYGEFSTLDSELGFISFEGHLFGSYQDIVKGLNVGVGLGVLSDITSEEKKLSYSLDLGMVYSLPTPGKLKSEVSASANNLLKIGSMMEVSSDLFLGMIFSDDKNDNNKSLFIETQYMTDPGLWTALVGIQMPLVKNLFITVTDVIQVKQLVKPGIMLSYKGKGNPKKNIGIDYAIDLDWKKGVTHAIGLNIGLF